MHVVRVAIAAIVLAASPVLSAAPCAGFNDVSDTDPFCVYVEWMKNRSITLGLTPTQYDPDSPVTRLQMAAFMYRLGYQNAFLQGGSAFGATAVLGTTDNQPLDVRANGARVMRYEPNAISPNVIGGSGANSVTAGVRGATIAGGGVPPAADPNFSNEAPNRVTDAYGTVGGGHGNLAGNDAGTTTDGAFATVGGGQGNAASAQHSTVAGGEGNSASSGHSTVGGGASNLASGPYSTIPGGYDNTAGGIDSFAAGHRANAQQRGCFVWSDSSAATATSCFQNNEFVARAVGGFYLWTAGFSDATYSGARLASGTGAWAAYSDRNGKQAVRPVDAGETLERVVNLPIATWQWKAETGDVRHMGPMAQDFHAVFGLGARDTEIVTVDADGVALAAIQGLNAKLEAKLAERDAEVALMRAELAELRSLRAELAVIRGLLAERPEIKSTQTARIGP